MAVERIKKILEAHPEIEQIVSNDWANVACDSAFLFLLDKGFTENEIDLMYKNWQNKRPLWEGDVPTYPETPIPPSK